jgi:uncharacterized glyoxalase superfamily protein PhnB
MTTRFFLKKTFGATDLRRDDMPDGTTMHAEVVDATFRRALDAGGVSIPEPTRKPGDPDKRGGVKDPAGNTWWIATEVEH